MLFAMVYYINIEANNVQRISVKWITLVSSQLKHFVLVASWRFNLCVVPTRKGGAGEVIRTPDLLITNELNNSIQHSETLQVYAV